jgi:hypothetical protein
MLISDKGASLFDDLETEWSCHRELLAVGFEVTSRVPSIGTEIGTERRGISRYQRIYSADIAEIRPSNDQSALPGTRS